MIKFKEYIELVKSVYPTYLTLLVLIPILVGFYIDYEVSNRWYELFANIIWIPLFTIPYQLTEKKIFYRIAAILFFSVGVFEIGHWLVLKGPVSTASLLAFSNTNFVEATEFLSVVNVGSMLSIIPYSILFFFALKLPNISYSSYHKYLFMILTTFIFGFYFYFTIDRFLVRFTPNFFRVTHAFTMEMKNHSKALKNNNLKEIDARQTLNEDEQLFVLIIGESASKNHMSIYNYYRETNPKLKAREDIIIFKDVISSYTFTVQAVLSMITDSNIDNELKYDKRIDLIDVFHSIGFKTFWLSNQSPYGVSESLISTIGYNKTDNSKFVNLTSNTTYESDLKGSYDEKLFKPFSEALNDKASKKFIILHLLGNHVKYDRRYPKKFDRFIGDGSKVEERIADYDNSMLYNDYILDSIFSLLKLNSLAKPNLVASSIYTSDHGENVYDEMGVFGHSYVKSIPKSNVEIPLLVWLSPRFILSDSLKASTINLNIKKPFVSDDLFHSILDLNSVDSPIFVKERSLFNPEYNFKRIRRLSDGEDYDSKIKMP